MAGHFNSFVASFMGFIRVFIKIFLCTLSCDRFAVNQPRHPTVNAATGSILWQDNKQATASNSLT